MFKKILLSMIVLAVIFFAGSLILDQNDDSFERVRADIETALDNRDAKKLAERVDLEKFFGDVYDDATVELAKNYDDYKQKYPEDPYFQHDKDFLLKYNADCREIHLKFLRDVQEAYFKNIPAPDKPEDNPPAYVADEFEKTRKAAIVNRKNIVVNGDKVMMTFEVKGDDSVRGQLIGTLNFKISFTRNEDDTWRVVKIENLDELMPTLVDKAEKVWITFSN